MTTATRRRFVRVNNPSYPEFAVGYEEGNFTSIKVRMVWSLKYFERKLKKILVSAPKDARLFSVTAMWSNEAMSKNLPKDSKDVWVLK